MGIAAPAIMNGRVMHARLSPKRNVFEYGIYYVALPLSALEQTILAREGFALTSFSVQDHGPRDGSPLMPWAKEILDAYGLIEADGEIVLVCMPRILGYVFNPVSFWVCHDRQGDIRAVICEVHNTFGERHSYLCAHPDHRPIRAEDRLAAQKLFHVSPFLKREGRYEFRFDIGAEKFGVWIDYYDGSGGKVLVTSLRGIFSPLDSAGLRRSFWRHPLVTLKAVALIHWQALKIISKGIGYIPKPRQRDERTSATEKITKV